MPKLSKAEITAQIAALEADLTESGGGTGSDPRHAAAAAAVAVRDELADRIAEALRTLDGQGRRAPVAAGPAGGAGGAGRRRGRPPAPVRAGARVRRGGALLTSVDELAELFAAPPRAAGEGPATDVAGVVARRRDHWRVDARFTDPDGHAMLEAIDTPGGWWLVRPGGREVALEPATATELWDHLAELAAS